jgi:hypothetical protein
MRRNDTGRELRVKCQSIAGHGGRAGIAAVTGAAKPVDEDHNRTIVSDK